MSDPDRHHFLPQFYLSRWANAQGKLSTYSRQRGKLFVREYAPKTIGAERGLYALNGVPPEHRNAVERDFMGPEIDDPAARALRILLSAQPLLPTDLRMAWVRFLMSLLVRLPNLLRKLKADASETLAREIAARPEEYEALRRPGHPQTLMEFLKERGVGGLIEGFGTTLIPGLVDLPQMKADIARMDWRVFHFRDGPYGLVTSDFPICMLPGLASPNCLISLPLSPTAIFLASYNSELLNQLDALMPPALIDAANRISIQSAQQYVYADTRDYFGLVDASLATTVEPDR
ncbi:DUF4238 domain-containing protein [Sphingobium chlorophenolicum]|uniref:DUF4238 domain-containing protein n=1 Tax=Sphingobium chlorophenolicum TaxID=46429 RepID=A0A081REV8_SPHCR|nr:DUF4238 domain-containing protein [Sphingobium chlorophenolicum]KEQ53731.1 hypothetical protein BV95_01947 [Sphingobium chlorophenolicum]